MPGSENGNPDSVDAKQMLEYGRLPNNKFMINWPNYGNDCFLDLTTATTDERKSKLQIAKNHTLGFVYFIQTELGMPHLGLAG
ncbi:MAG: FAD-dependent oxidoreductase [Calditrichia bacterium]